MPEEFLRARAFQAITRHPPQPLWGRHRSNCVRLNRQLLGIQPHFVNLRARADFRLFFGVLRPGGGRFGGRLAAGAAACALLTVALAALPVCRLGPASGRTLRPCRARFAGRTAALPGAGAALRAGDWRGTRRPPAPGRSPRPRRRSGPCRRPPAARPCPCSRSTSGAVWASIGRQPLLEDFRVVVGPQRLAARASSARPGFRSGGPGYRHRPRARSRRRA